MHPKERRQVNLLAKKMINDFDIATKIIESDNLMMSAPSIALAESILKLQQYNRSKILSYDVLADAEIAVTSEFQEPEDKKALREAYVIFENSLAKTG